MIDLTGLVVERLTVLRRVPYDRGDTKWLCVCSCGTETTVLGSMLRGKRTKSCGCLRREMGMARGKVFRLRHGEARDGHVTVEYQTWDSMVRRCTNSKHVQFKDYGGRGITVCARWLTFENFLADVGRRPAPDLSIDRIDNERGYEPGNVRWATRVQQNNNRRPPRKRPELRVTTRIGGVTRTLHEWAEASGVLLETVKTRYYRGDRGERLIRAS